MRSFIIENKKLFQSRYLGVTYKQMCFMDFFASSRKFFYFLFFKYSFLCHDMSLFSLCVHTEFILNNSSVSFQTSSTERVSERKIDERKKEKFPLNYLSWIWNYMKCCVLFIYFTFLSFLCFFLANIVVMFRFLYTFLFLVGRKSRMHFSTFVKTLKYLGNFFRWWRLRVVYFLLFYK